MIQREFLFAHRLKALNLTHFDIYSGPKGITVADICSLAMSCRQVGRMDADLCQGLEPVNSQVSMCHILKRSTVPTASPDFKGKGSWHMVIYSRQVLHIPHSIAINGASCLGGAADGRHLGRPQGHQQPSPGT